MTAALVAPGVRLIEIPLNMALRSVNAYLVEGDRGWSLVDSGIHTDEAVKALSDGLATAGISAKDVQRTFITHYHPDHIGLAGMMGDAGSEVVMHRPEARYARRVWSGDRTLREQFVAYLDTHGLPADIRSGAEQAWILGMKTVLPLPPITEVEDGGPVTFGGRATRAVWTPGHTDHHAVLVEDGERLLFSGDHVLPRITSNVGLYPHGHDNPLGEYLDSVGRLAALPIGRVLPAHGQPFDDLRGRVEQILEHHAARLEECLTSLEKGPRTAYEVRLRLFGTLRGGHEERFALVEILAHLRLLERRGRVRALPGSTVRWERI
ncbi:MAG: MBL fold metallo-hydrolase [Chloroflexi bacterium]|nr:MBL fold metallo-hydrolase [Chloroflexota bacterium]